MAQDSTYSWGVAAIFYLLNSLKRFFVYLIYENSKSHLTQT